MSGVPEPNVTLYDKDGQPVSVTLSNGKYSINTNDPSVVAILNRISDQLAHQTELFELFLEQLRIKS